MIAVSVRIWRKPVVEPPVKHAVKHQVNDALFPRRNVQCATLSVEIVREPNRGPELECLTLKRTVNRIQTSQAASRKLVQVLAVGRYVESFAPVKQRLGVHAHGRLVQFDLAIHVLPTKTGGGFYSRLHAHFGGSTLLLNPALGKLCVNIRESSTQMFQKFDLHSLPFMAKH